MNICNLQHFELDGFWKDSDYPDAFNAEPLPHRHFTHALTHAMKALGGLASYTDALDHERMAKRGYADPEAQMLDDSKAKWLADLVICASRMAQQSGIDLDQAVAQRVGTLRARWPSDPSARAATTDAA